MMSFVKAEDAKETEALLNQAISKAAALKNQLSTLASVEARSEYLSSLPQVHNFLEKEPDLKKQLERLSSSAQYVLKALFALEQGPIVFEEPFVFEKRKDAFERLITHLLETEQFYQNIGGLVGYHLKVLELMQTHLFKSHLCEACNYLEPPVIDIRKPTKELQELIIDGISAMDLFAEAYVVGGAGDRLHLVDETTGRPLPAARLPFSGKTLFEGLLIDLQAREYLHYKLFGKQIVTPVLLMTSPEKKNDVEIDAILKERRFFGRPKESFFLLTQPLAPVLTIDAKWAISKPLELVLKPGGHGVIWKLAKDQGAFKWLEKQGKKNLIIRQINNPLGGLDYGLLALAGFGNKHRKAFGFASCPRLENVSEGMNVLKEKIDDSGIHFTITNVEYTEFAKKKKEEKTKETSAHDLKESRFPANTNILFANISEVEKAIDKLPIPGMLVNMKHAVEVQRKGKIVTLPGARLESTMQNIADVLTDTLALDHKKLSSGDLKTFVLLGDRLKTMSVTKKAFERGAPIQETPEGCFYDLLLANHELLEKHCHVRLPPKQSINEYLLHGPEALFLYHPALGPLYSIIEQKIRGGSFKAYSELQLDISDVWINNLELDGSLLIAAERIMGTTDPETNILHFDNEIGRCYLENVKVINKGIDRTAQNCYWKKQIVRKEALKITLEGHSEFIAKDIIFTGHWDIRVPAGMKAIACYDQEGKVEICYEPLYGESSWQWRYLLSKENKIILQKKSQVEENSPFESPRV